VLEARLAETAAVALHLPGAAGHQVGEAAAVATGGTVMKCRYPLNVIKDTSDLYIEIGT
jgi:hypothetical protein